MPPGDIDPNQINWEGQTGRDKTKSSQETTQRDVNIQGDKATLPYKGPQAAVSLQKDQAQLPYVAPQAETNLTKDKLAVKYAPLEQSEKLRNAFSGNKDVFVYSKSIPQLVAALNSAPTPAGDLSLLYAAAKLSDADSAVREGEQKLWAEIMPVIRKYAAQFGKQVLDGGTFDEKSRADIRREIIHKVASYGSAYDRERRNYTKTAERYGLPPEDVVGEHAGAPFLKDLVKYDEANLLTKRIKANGGDPKADTTPLNAAPHGEPIRGKRLSPEQEAEISGMVRAPDFNPEAVADKMAEHWVAAGGITPEQAPAYRQSALESLKDIIALPPEERARINAFDYSSVDEEAAKGASLGENLLQTGKNVPESAANLIGGLTALPADAIVSVLTGERSGSFKSMTDLAAELVMAAGGSAEDTPTINAFTKVMEDRYGSLDALKQTAITDPVGLASDVSMVLTGGGAAMGRVPGAVGTAGRALETSGRALDPISAGLAAVTQGAPAIANAAPGLVEGVQNLPSEVVGFPSGLGGGGVREAASAGYERGVTGAPTAASQAFTENMRNPGVYVEDTIAMAREGVGALREQASQAYQAGMQQFGRAPAPLPLAGVLRRVARLRPHNYEAMLGAPNRPSSHVAWDNINNTVQHYAVEAANDPNLLLPMQVDAFKQDLYDIGSRIGGAYDRDAARVAGAAYGAVRDELVRHDPIYADTMRDYERAAREAQQLEASFGLAAARGKQPNMDNAARRLQSIFRNNANTNYGMRARQGERLAELDPSGTLMPSLAGQAASTWTPRGLQAATPVGLTALAGASAIPTLGTMSPRLVGESMYGMGRAVGTGRRLAEPGLDALSAAYDIQQQHPQLTLAAARTGETARDVELERQKELMRRYGIVMPGEGLEDLSQYAGGM